jgi:hypothetical protein
LPRPHTNELATAGYNLSLLASRHHPRDDPRQSSGFDDIAAIIWLLVKLDADIAESRQAAPFGPGVEGGIRALPRGSSHADIDARTHDRLLKEQQQVRASLLIQLARLRDHGFQQYEELVGRHGVGTVAQ